MEQNKELEGMVNEENATGEIKEIKKESFGQKIKKHLPSKKTVVNVCKKLAYAAGISAVAIIAYVAMDSKKDDTNDMTVTDNVDDFAAEVEKMVNEDSESSGVTTGTF